MNQNDNKSKIIRWTVIITVVLILAAINVFYFINKTSSNHELASHYTSKGDPMEKYRNPAVAGLFYSADPKNLEQEVDYYLGAQYQKHLSAPKIIIVPHAGYRYSASAAAQAYLPLKDYAENIKTVILIGPSHYVPMQGAALPDAEYFKTPLGDIKINEDIAKKLLKNNIFSLNNEAHRQEHSLEVQLPFLQKVLKDFTIVPIVYSNIYPQDLADALVEYVSNPEVLLVVSADLSHYHSYGEAVIMDNFTADKIAENKPNIDYHHSCGAAGINTALLIGSKLHLKPEVLALINSGDVSDEKNRVVGYGAWSFSSDGLELSRLEREYNGLKSFAAQYKGQLLDAARKSLTAAAGGNAYSPSRSEYEEHMFDRGAAFVTLYKNGNLRGCIGSLYPRQAIVVDVANNAYNAARRDGRFYPVTPDELSDIRISVSMLTGYEKIHYKDEEDLISLIKPGIDGLVIRDGDRQGLFLPSVWEQIPDPRDFLNNLKLKAGMSPSFWSNDITVYRFRTVEVKENED